MTDRTDPALLAAVRAWMEQYTWPSNDPIGERQRLLARLDAALQASPLGQRSRRPATWINVCPTCGSDMPPDRHGLCQCGRHCGCSFDPGSLGDYCDAHRPDDAPATKPDRTPLVRALVKAVDECRPQSFPCAPGNYSEYHISDPGYWEDIVAAARALVAAWPEVGG